MRPIKFRVWSRTEKEFDYEVVAGNILAAIHGSGDPLSEDEKYWYTLQQYTGLKDKNGKEIYEGDIIKGICSTYGDGIAVVGLDTTFGIFYTDIDYYPATAFSHCFSMMQEHNEVIGNIFENPELLDKTKEL